MATLSILSCGSLSQGLQMKTTNSGTDTSSASSNNSNSNSNISASKSPSPTASVVDSNTISASRIGKTFSKIVVQNVLSENNANALNISNNNSANTIVRKIKDFGMYGTVNNSGSTAAHTKRPLSELKANSNPPRVPGVAKKSKLAAHQAVNESPKPRKKQLDKMGTVKAKTTPTGARPAGTPGRKGLPLPLAVARRNARERNRVKQVNNGFAALRERIPEEVAEAFEAQGNGRGVAKKLSKVETLRMAVEYIRSLERLLGFDFPLGGVTDANGNSTLHLSSSGEDSFTLIKDEFDTLSPTLDDPFDDSLSNYDMDDYFPAPSASNNSINDLDHQPLDTTNVSGIGQLDALPSITTLNGLQYIRIPGTNTYQLLTPEVFIGSASSPPNSSIDDEHFNSLIETNCLSPSPSLATTAADQQSSPTTINRHPANATHAPAPASPAESGGGECAPTSLSPVTHVPTPLARLHSSLHQQQQRQQQQQTTPALSPAANKGALQACAAATAADGVAHEGSDRQFVAPTPLQQQRLCTSQPPTELGDVEFAAPPAVAMPMQSPSPSVESATLVYQSHAQPAPPLSDYDLQQQQHDNTRSLLAEEEHASSPPIEHSSVLPSLSAAGLGLHSYFMAQPSNIHSSSFYEGVLMLKRQFDEVLLGAAGDASSEVMESIDWWEAHTPKSDGDNSIAM